jgi:type III restriction enzyme
LRSGAGERTGERLSAEVKRGKEMARLWISGIEALQRVVKAPVQVCDLSATPVFLRGSGIARASCFRGWFRISV